MRQAAAASRHLAWCCALGGALLLPLGYPLLPQWRVLPAWLRWEEAPRLFAAKPTPAPAAELLSDTTATGAPVGIKAVPQPTRPRAAASRSVPVVPRPLRLQARWLLGTWLGVAGLCLAPLCLSVLALRRTSRRARAITSGAVFDAVTRVGRELGLRRIPLILLDKAGAMPMVWGLGRGALLLPGDATEWPAPRLRAVLLHELAHLRRRDPLILALAQCALAMHWFNPLAWLAVGQLRREAERACDDCVLRHGLRPSDYATEMLTLATARPPGPAGFAALTMARPTGLEARITGILDASRNRRALTLAAAGRRPVCRAADRLAGGDVEGGARPGGCPRPHPRPPRPGAGGKPRRRPAELS